MKNEERHPSTLCVQGKHTQTSGPAVVPIVQTSTFVFENQQAMFDSVQGKSSGHVYTRWSNPTTKNVEEKISALEGTEDTHVLASGMAAISSAVMGVVKSGERILSSDSIYGGTVHLFNKILLQYGIQVDYIDTDEIVDRLADSGDTYKLCFFETPTNPTLKVVDIKNVADAARATGTISMIDSTVVRLSMSCLGILARVTKTLGFIFHLLMSVTYSTTLAVIIPTPEYIF